MVPAKPPAGERLENVRVPPLVVMGTRDVPRMLELADELVSRIPNARRAELESDRPFCPSSKQRCRLGCTPLFPHSSQVSRFGGNATPISRAVTVVGQRFSVWRGWVAERMSRRRPGQRLNSLRAVEDEAWRTLGP
jgi:hypothetical protein